MFRPTRLLLIHLVVCVHVYTAIIIYAFPFPRTRRVTSNYVSKYRSFFFPRRIGSRLFIGPRAHDCYLSIDDKRNPIGEARLTRIEKVGEKVGKLA